MADKKIGDLPRVGEITNDSMLPLEQGGVAYNITGEQFKRFAEDAAEAFVGDAEQAAENAAASAEEAKGDQQKIAAQLKQATAEKDAAAGYANQAAASLQKLLDLIVTAVASEPGSAAAVEKIVDSLGSVTLKFTIPRGVPGPMGTITGLERTAGDGSGGTVDTWTFTCSDGATFSFTNRNGKDGTGQGDMVMATYDPNGKKTDIFAYCDKAIETAIGEALGGGY